MKKPKQLKIFRTKKAIMAEVGFWIIRILILTFSIIALVTMKNSAINKLTRTHGLEHKIIINRLIYSPTAFAYVDPQLNRAYPGIIDLEKFNETYLNNSFKTDYPLALRLVLEGEKITREIYHDKESYDFLLPLTVFKDYRIINDTRLVVIHDKGERRPGFLYIELIASDS